MKLKLTIKSVTAQKPKDKYYDIWDADIKGFFLRVLPSGTHTYYLFYRNAKNEKRTYKIGKGLTAVQARDIAQKKLGEVASGIDICEQEKSVKQEAIKSKATTLKSFLETIYKPWLLDNRKSAMNAYNRINHSFALLSAKQLESISAWDIELWRKKRKKSGVTDYTLKKDLTELKSMVARAKRWGFIKVDPIYDFKYGSLEDNRVDRYLTVSERKRLDNGLDDREHELIIKRESGNQWRKTRGYELMTDYSNDAYVDFLKPMVILALNTGLRRGELFQLRWDNVNLDNAQITVASTTAKSKKARYIPLNKEALEMMKQWRSQNADQDNVFYGKDSKPLTDIKKSWSSLMERAGITKFRFHDMRHDFASQLVMKGVDLYVVKELLGHSTIQMTERYAHLAPKQLEDAVSLLNA